MQQKLVLFDIDGTLLFSRGAGRRALTHVLAERIGDPTVFERVRFDGKTDPQIIVELLSAAGRHEEAEDGLVGVLCDEYLALLERDLSARESPRPEVMPGVRDLLTALEEDERVILGLLTGNLARGAALKLRAAGLDPARFPVGAFGSDSRRRAELPPIATRRAKPWFGSQPRGSQVVIIGDTPADVTCGLSIGARALAVATGNYLATELRAAGAFAVFKDLADHEPVVEAIFAVQ